jgi:hypothetical protein
MQRSRSMVATSSWPNRQAIAKLSNNSCSSTCCRLSAAWVSPSPAKTGRVSGRTPLRARKCSMSDAPVLSAVATSTTRRPHRHPSAVLCRRGDSSALPERGFCCPAHRRTWLQQAVAVGGPPGDQTWVVVEHLVQAFKVVVVDRLFGLDGGPPPPFGRSGSEPRTGGRASR